MEDVERGNGDGLWRMKSWWVFVRFGVWDAAREVSGGGFGRIVGVGLRW